MLSAIDMTCPMALAGLWIVCVPWSCAGNLPLWYHGWLSCVTSHHEWPAYNKSPTHNIPFQLRTSEPTDIFSPGRFMVHFGNWCFNVFQMPNTHYQQLLLFIIVLSEENIIHFRPLSKYLNWFWLLWHTQWHCRYISLPAAMKSGRQMLTSRTSDISRRQFSPARHSMTWDMAEYFTNNLVPENFPRGRKFTSTNMCWREKKLAMAGQKMYAWK